MPEQDLRSPHHRSLHVLDQQCSIVMQHLVHMIKPASDVGLVDELNAVSIAVEGLYKKLKKMHRQYECNA